MRRQPVPCLARSLARCLARDLAFGARVVVLLFAGVFAAAIAGVFPGMSACTPAFEEGVDCQNGVDDDGDGLIDCADPDCALAPQCQTCGNGKLDPGETCDDGFLKNGTPGDPCSRYCGPATCPNGVVDPGEECDDGNLVPGDGCSAQCKIDHCGDNVLDPGEECEDGNRTDGDGCDHTCHAEPSTTCGDGQFEQNEQCDDGNRQSGDGCSATCLVEFCGDGIVQPARGEQCDDADPHTPNCSGCQIPVCGNFITERGEQCDLGTSNGLPGSGCTKDCKLE